MAISAARGSAVDLRSAWLSDDVLAAVVTLPEGARRLDGASILWNGARIPAPFLRIRPDTALVASRVRSSSLDGARLELAVDGAALSAGPTLREASTDLRSFLRRLAGLDPAARGNAVRFLSTIAARDGERRDERLRISLQLARDGLREPLPASVVARDRPRAVALDAVVAAGDGAFYLRGWMRDTVAEPTELAVVTPEGEHVDLLAGSFWEGRPDVDAALGGAPAGRGARGFVRFVETDSKSLGDRRWILELRGASGAVEASGPPVVTDPAEARAMILRDLAGKAAPPAELFRDHVRPAVARIQAGLAASGRIDRVHTFGEVPASPDVTVLVPLGGELELVEHQLAQFAADPELERAELIYLLSRADEGGSVVPLVRSLFELYRVPFRLALLRPGAGLAASVNAAAGIAAGRLLVLLDADVIPARPAFLGRLVALHRTTLAAGAVGAKLLREDGSIDHAGLAVARSDDGVSAEPRHRGMHGSLPAANEPCEVDAVDGCLVVAADAFRRAGGLRGAFVEEAHEYLDLCLRLRALGRETWYAPGAELHHLDELEERPASSEVASRYDALLLAHVLDEYAAGAVPRALRPARLPDAGSTDGGLAPARRADDERLVELTEVVPLDPGTGALRAARLDQPVAEARSEYTLTFAGHALGGEAEVEEIEIASEGEVLWRLGADVATPGVGAQHAAVAGADRCGFRAHVSAFRLPPEFELELSAVLANGRRATFAAVRGRRRLLQPAFEPRIRPIFVTTLGRTGSSWLVLLLAQHPEVVAYLPFRYEPRVTSYWLDAFAALAEPHSYLQAIDPELYEGHWWLGDRRASPFRLNRPEPRVPRWLGRENVEAVAEFSLRQIEAFYAEVAALQGRENVGYFVEKRWPDRLGPALAAELCPGSREIILVRDFRDMACSVLGFNAKRGFASFGREHAATDEEFIRNLRRDALRIADSWRERCETAHLLRYEDLILEPERTLTAALRYIEVDAGAETVAGMLADAAASEVEGQQGHRTTNGPAASVGRWRTDLDGALKVACRESFDDILVELGYAATTDG